MFKTVLKLMTDKISKDENGPSNLVCTISGSVNLPCAILAVGVSELSNALLDGIFSLSCPHQGAVDK